MHVYRYPNLKSVRELIYKRGYGKLKQRRTALTDNAIVEQNCNSKIVLFREGSVCFNLLLICYNVVTDSGEVWHYLRIEVFIVPGSGSYLNTNMLMVSTLVFGFEFQKILLPSQIVFTIYEYSVVLICSLDFIITCSMWFYLLICQILCLLQDLSSFRNIRGHNLCCLVWHFFFLLNSSGKNILVFIMLIYIYSVKKKIRHFFDFHHRIVCHVSLVHVFLSNLLASENP